MQFYLASLLLTLSVSVYSQTLTFTRQPNASYYVHTSVPLVIQCASSGTQITYRRANSPISTTTANEAYTLTPVENTDASDSGVVWDCLAEDSSGFIVSSRALVFWSRFRDSSSSAGNPQQIDVKSTVNSYLPCDFFNESVPTPTVTWMMNGILIPNPKILPGSNSLFLLTTDITSGAMYICVLTNREGGTVQVQALRIYQLRLSQTSIQPLIYPNTDITVTAGDTVYFECVGHAAVCTWEQFSNGTWIQLSTAANVVVRYSNALISFQIATDSPTQYRAVLGGNIQTPITITINESPNVISSIQGMLVEYELQNISIYCETTGSPGPTIMWYHNNLLVQNLANKYTLTTGGNRSTLQIKSLGNTDSGYYTCRADNSFDSAVVTSRLNVRLAVPPVIIQNPTPNMISDANNGMFNFTCIANGDPAPVITWLFTSKDTSNQITIVANTKYSINSNLSIEAIPVQSTLSVASFDSRDNGDYRCRAANFRDSIDSGAATVLVATDPIILSTFPNTSVVVTESGVVTQDCEGVGEPGPTVKWFAGNTEISQNSSVLTLYPNNTLKIETTRLQSGTVYRCEAMNNRATVTSSFTLTVNSCPLAVVSPTGPLNSLDNVNTTLSCSVSGNPAPVTIWNYRRPGSDTAGTLPGSADNVFQFVENGVLNVNITPITENNQGSYCCETYTQALETQCGESVRNTKCVEVEYRMSCGDLYFCLFELWHLIVIIVGGIVLVVLAVCGISCLVYLMYRHYQSNTYNINKAKDFNLPYKKNDDDSDDDGEFDPTYESLPANKSVHPPVYKMAPYYDGGGTTSGPPPYNPPPMAMNDTTGIPLDGLMAPPQLAYPPSIDMHHQGIPMLQGNFAQPPEMYTTEFMNPEMQMYPVDMVKGPPEEFLSTDGQFV